MFSKRLKIYIILASIVAAVTMSGCAEEKPKAKFTLGTLEKIDKTVYESSMFANVFFDSDKTLAYVLTNKGLVFNVVLPDGIQSFKDKKNWTKLTLKNEKNDDSVGKAKLEGFEEAAVGRRIFPTSKGILVLTNFFNAAGAANVGVLAYFEGPATVPTYAWTNEATHVEGAVLADNSPWKNAFAVTHGGKEYFLVSNGAAVVSSVELGPNQFKGSHVKAPPFAGPPGLHVPLMVANADTIFFISDSGVSTLKMTDLGQTQPVEVAVEGEASNWRMDTVSAAGVGVVNNTLDAAVIHNNKIYIALRVGLRDTGGIAVYDIAATKTTPPDREMWSNIHAQELKVVDGKLMALVGNVLVEINAEGTIGSQILSADLVRSKKFSSKMLVLREDIEGKTFYKNVDVFEGDLTRVFPMGSDFIIQATGGSPIILSYSPREITVEPAEKTEEKEE